MDKFEYKVRAEEIKALIAQGEYVQAADIADTIDWRRVKSVMMLCIISDLYKINRRLEDARDLLLLAYDRHPGGRTIIYSLCELSIKMEDIVQAVEYYKEFVQIAHKDTGRYILQYKLYEAQDVSLEERIAVLEEFKKRDYREKWAYELAYLYHRVGLSTRCIEECDELILWFGEGKYVIKAMELKMLHQPLTPAQRKKYENRFGQEPVYEDINENSYDNQEEVYYTDQNYDEAAYQEPAYQEAVYQEPIENLMQAPTMRMPYNDMDIQVKTMDVGQYNTINLQKELAEGLKEVLGEGAEVNDNSSISSSIMEADTETYYSPLMEDAEEHENIVDMEEMQVSEVFFGETSEMGRIQEQAPVISDTAELVMEQLRRESLGIAPKEETDSIKENLIHSEPPKELAKVLSMESDGQISLVMQESEQIEKQITGQLSIEDILAEWERMKKDNEVKRKEAVRQRVMEQTGTMFTEFEAAVRDGLLEQLEKKKEAENTVNVIKEETAIEEEAEFTLNSIEEGAEPSVNSIEEDAELTVNSMEEEIENAVNENSIEVDYEDTSMEEEPESVIEEEDEVEELTEIVDYEEAVRSDIPEDELEFAYEAVDIVEEQEFEYEIEEEEELQEDSNQVEVAPVENKARIRNLNKEERELFGSFVQNRSSREQLVTMLDNISMAAYTGNVIVTGDEGMDTMSLAKNIIRDVQMTDRNFSGKVAMITGGSLNQRDLSSILQNLINGALIIQKATEMSNDTALNLYKILQKESMGIIIVLEDTKKAMDTFLKQNHQLSSCFNARMDVEPLSNESLVVFGNKYAKEMEYSIDELGILALHTRIEEMQTINHAVTIMEVKDIVDAAIRSANRKSIRHFFDILLAKRYDEEDMIILRERDFL